MGMFLLEALQAKHGDCLILHYGPDDDPSLILIDGGPETVYRKVLLPRLAQIKEERSMTGPLPISLVMVSHIDDDHINGLLDLTDALIDDLADERPRRFAIDALWHNSFEDIIGNDALPDTASAAAAVASVLPQFVLPEGREYEGAVLASVPQGQRLRDNARRLNLTPVNPPFEGLIRADRTGPIEWEKDLHLHVVAPSAQRLRQLQDEWDKHLKKQENKKKAAVAAYRDNSPYNLSSIVVLASHGGKRMLLTGDARGDDILQGLASEGLLDAHGRIHVDLLKLPHHGSQHNVEPEFFERVTADHYVVSGDRDRHPNPHPDAMRWLRDARGDDDYTVWLTYDLPTITEIFPRGRCRSPGEGSQFLEVSVL
jgi:beta-lactamase superfamily II metal-dependent hydrolase